MSQRIPTRLRSRASALLAAVALVAGFGVVSAPASASESGWLHTDGARIVTEAGEAHTIRAVSWLGLETSNCAPHGLWTISLDEGLQTIAGLGFNAIRLPYANECLTASSTSSIDANANPDLVGLTPLQVMDAVIDRASAYGLDVILDRHRPTTSGQSSLWYTSEVDEQQWIDDWVMLAERYADDPTLVFLPILLATSASTLAGLLAVAAMQRLRLWDPVVLAYLIPTALLLGGFMSLLAGMSATALAALSSLLGNLTLFGLILLFLVVGALRRVAVYESFIEGAKEGFDVAKSLLPYLVAMLCAIGVLRASGALDFGLDGIRWLVEALGWDTRFVDALPTALIKPFSGGAARAMLIETMENFGVDSFPALIAATMQGSTETTFYVLAVYFGAVGLQRARHAVGCALVADAAGIVAAIAVCYWFFG